MLQSPLALFIIKYHNLSPAGAVEAGGTWRIQKYSEWQDSLCSLQEEIYLKAGGGCILWPLLFSLTVKKVEFWCFAHVLYRMLALPSSTGASVDPGLCWV